MPSPQAFVSNLPPQATCAGSPDRRSGSGSASLEWVRTADGLLGHVSSWAHLPPHERPRNTRGEPPAVVCPVCKGTWVIKIPKYKAHHAAHAPGAVCRVTRPETALHFNLKCLIATELRLASTAGMPLLVQDTCVAGNLNVSREQKL